MCSVYATSEATTVTAKRPQCLDSFGSELLKLPDPYQAVLSLTVVAKSVVKSSHLVLLRCAFVLFVVDEAGRRLTAENCSCC